MTINKKFLNSYINKPVNSKYYGTFKITGNINESKNIIREYSYKLVPWISIVTHVEIFGPNGIKKIRQVSYWFLFKLWLFKLIYNSVMNNIEN